MAQRVRIHGLRELEKALAEIPKNLGKGALRRVLQRRAEPVASAMRAMAPDDPGTSGNDLRGSIAVSTRLSARQRSQHKKWGSPAAVEMFVGAGPLPQAHLQEFGTAHHGPQSFARPAWDAEQHGMLEGLKDDLWNEIAKTAARYSRRQARLAAKAR